MKTKLTLFLFALVAAQAINAQSIRFIQNTTQVFDSVNLSSVAFADVDGDNDQDLLITGATTSQKVANLYLNDGTGAFTLQLRSPFNAVSSGSVAFADIDGDNDMDLLITGSGNSQKHADLYTNDGNGNYSLVPNTPFDAVDNSSIAFADFDGDQDQDVIITGDNSSSQKIAKIYTNDGTGGYSLSTASIAGVWLGSVAVADFDGDNDIDIIVTGLNAISQASTRLYLNDSTGQFTFAGSGIENVQRGAIAAADVDGDNDIDIAISGYTNGAQRIARLYKNNGTASFTSAGSFDGNQNGSIDFSDVDGDNDQDVLITGFNPGAQRIAKLYENDGNGAYTLVSGLPFTGVNVSAVAFADVDGDNDEDVVITGASSSITLSSLYLNSPCGNISGVDTKTECVSYTWLDGITYTADNDTATFTIVGGASNGCDSIARLDLTIVQPTTGIDNQNACNSFRWIDGMMYTESNDTATFTIVGGAANGCDSVVTLNLQIDTLNLNTSLTGTSIMAEDSLASYQWLDCNNSYSVIAGDTNQTYTASANGSYAVELSLNACVDTTDCVDIIGISVVENSLANALRVYPNPSKGSFQLDFETVQENIELQLINVEGRVIEVEAFQNTQNISMNIDQPKGIYFLRLMNEKSDSYLVRLVIE